jgi:cold shock CspA family protein
MRGQVKFFNDQRNFGVIEAENGDEHYFSGREWLGESIHRNEWCMFDSIPNTNPNGEKFVAVKVQPIECPEEHLSYGRVRSYFLGRKYGFIDYVQNSQSESAFFHLSDVLLIDGRECAPCEGCRVSFCLGQKTNRPLATQIKILSWPEGPDPAGVPDLDQYFLNSEELPLAPVVVQEPSVLSAGNRKKTLLEIVRQRSEGKLK